MADFKPVYKKVLQFEGGYVNDPNDHGGETFAGIARAGNPKWAGWPIIDRIKRRYDLSKKAEIKKMNGELFANDELMKQHILHSKKTFWDSVRGDEIKNQKLAEFIFDFFWGSPKYALKVIKESVKTVKARHPDLSGLIDNSLLKSLNTLPPGELFNEMYQMRGAFYKKIVEKDPTQQKFLNGWMNRLKSWAGDLASFGKEFASTVIEKTKEEKKTAMLVLGGGLAAAYLLTRKRKKNG